MALIIRDRVQESTTTAGSGSFALGGAATGFAAFSSVMADADTTYYAISSGVEWEVGLGTYVSSGNSLARTTVYANSAGTAPTQLAFSAGTKYVWIDFPAARTLYKAADDSIASPTFSGTLAGIPTVNTASSLSTQIVQVDFGTTPVNAQSFSVTISTDLWAAAQNVMATPWAGTTSPDNGSLTADEYEMDGLMIAAYKSASSGLIGLYINAGSGFVAGKRNIAIKLF